MDWDEHSQISSGGTELMGRRLERYLPPALLAPFQIVLNGDRPPDPERIPVLWVHMEPREPVYRHLQAGGWRRFERIVFVSNTQAQNFIRCFGIPWSRCTVIPNCIEPISVPAEAWAPPAPGEPVRLVYTPTPMRGLGLLHQAFRWVAERRDDVELDVYSSFRLYGWGDRDRELEPLYDALRAHPRINYHGTVPNEELRAALPRAHVFAYPSQFEESGPLTVMEAMSAGLVCVHPNLGALPEAGAGHTMMYDFHENPREHLLRFTRRLLAAVEAVRSGHPDLARARGLQKQHADRYHDIGRRMRQWENLFQEILAEKSAYETVTST